MIYMAEFKRKYFIRLENQLVEVNHEVYTAYYQMNRQERYQREKDLRYRLLHYDAWDTEDSNGVESIADTLHDTEQQVIASIVKEMILRYIDQIDKGKILSYLMSGKKEKEIAELLCTSQSKISRTKSKLLKQLQSYWEENFK